jgi:4,5-DOPA dioxygenase extradiol
MIGRNSGRMPCAFLGHGTPLNVLADNDWTRSWRRIATELPQPRAILAISAHWCTHGTGVTAMTAPPTIHDFGGFPKPMYDIRYPAPGDPALARRVCELLAPLPVVLDESWGLDHGTWSVLCKAYPDATIPVVQLSIDMTQPPAFHFAVGAHLAPLRDEGVLILGTGNVVHNLMLRRRDDAFAYDWAIKFNDFVRDSLLAHEFNALVDYERVGEAAALSAPTPDHYYPLLYVAGAAGADPAAIEIDGVFEGAMSMMSVVFGKDAPPAATARGFGI